MQRERGRWSPPHSRRQFLQAAGAAGLLGLAGCSTSGGDTEPTDSNRTPPGSPLDGVAGHCRQSQYDAANTGYRASGGTASDPSRRWSVQTAPSGPAYACSSPVAADGTVYFAEGGDRDGTVRCRFYAVDAATGAVEWFEDGPETNAFADGAVVDGTYVQPVSGTLVALDAASGERLWEFSADLDSGVAVADGTVYVLGAGYNDPMTLYALDLATGEERWSRAIGSGWPSTPAVFDGTVYVALGGLWAVSTDGHEQWQRSFEDALVSSPTVHDGTVYAGAEGNGLYAVAAADGTVRSRATVPSGSTSGTGPVDASPAVGAGRVVATNNWQLTALDVGGERAWTTEIPESGPPVVAGDAVYVSGIDSLAAYALGSGERRWRVETASTSGGPTVPAVLDGGVYGVPAGLLAVA